MARLYGKMRASRGEVERAGQTAITTEISCGRGRVCLQMRYNRTADKFEWQLIVRPTDHPITENSIASGSSYSSFPQNTYLSDQYVDGQYLYVDGNRVPNPEILACGEL